MSDAAPDLLADAAWVCGFCRPDTGCRPDALEIDSPWVAASVPGTAAGAFLDHDDEVSLLRDYDRREWWFRCRFPAPADAGSHVLRLGGLATVADVWLNGEHLLRSENMFLAHEVPVEQLREDNELVLRFSPLAEVLGGRRPRPRWRTVRLADQNLRWVRTSLLGRLSGRVASPAPVGPWRPITLRPTEPVRFQRRLLTATPRPDGSGTVVLEADVDGVAAGEEVAVTVGGVRREVALLPDPDGHGAFLRAEVDVPDVRLWWPHTHGEQPLYDVHVTVGETSHRLGRVGFRTVEIDRTDGAFTFEVNGVPIFARGTNWTCPDPVRIALDDERLRHNVELLRAGNANMVRVPGTGVYEDERFLDLLDEVGLLLWQDAMFAYVDVPDTPEFVAGVVTEVSQVLTGLQGRPCVALVCGGADTEEQAQFMGVESAQWSSLVARETIPQLVTELLPGTAYLRATPGDSPLPTVVDHGVGHYYGVPGYLRPLSDVRAAGVRFAAECLPFATPPDPLGPADEAVVRRGRGQAPDPRHAVHRDSLQSIWDMEDARDHYTRDIFGVDPLALRQQQPELAQLTFQATSVQLVEWMLAEWRRPGSPCAGALSFYWHDPLHGPGIGQVDVLHRPKPTWHAVRRMTEPLGLVVTDENFSGLGLHVVQDGDRPVSGSVRVDLFVHGETLVETATTPVKVPARGVTTVDTTVLFGGFRDLSYAYRFGEPAADVVAMTLLDDDGETLGRVVHLPGGPRRDRVQDVGLRGTLDLDGELPSVTVTTREFAQWARLEVPGWWPEDSWFHLLPGETRTVRLRPLPGTTGQPRGDVGAFNSKRVSRLLRAG